MIDYKYKLIKPEEVVINTNYAFSFNPEDQPCTSVFYNVKIDEFESWSKKQYKTFSILRYSTIQTFMEISKGGRLHFHGYIKINDIPNFYFYDLKRLMKEGTFEIDFIKDPLIWDLYIKKQKPFMEKFCSINNMDYLYPIV